MFIPTIPLDAGSRQKKLQETNSVIDCKGTLATSPVAQNDAYDMTSCIETWNYMKLHEITLPTKGIHQNWEAFPEEHQSG